MEKVKNENKEIFDFIQKRIDLQNKSDFELKNRDKIFLRRLDKTWWYPLKEICNVVPYKIGYVGTVMPWLERKNLVKKTKINNKVHYMVI